MVKTRLLIADDHPIVREGFKQVLSETSDMIVADEASNDQVRYYLGIALEKQEKLDKAIEVYSNYLAANPTRLSLRIRIGELFIKKKKYDVVLLDISMPGRSGLEILKEVKTDYPGLPVLIVSIYPD